MESPLEQAEAILAANEQEHALRFLDKLKGQERERLCEQILDIDLEQLKSIIAQHDGQMTAAAGGIEPIGYEDWAGIEESERVRYTRLGWEQLQRGKVAGVVVAGGHGSRLGHDGPKGTIDIGLPSGKSLFELQADRFSALSEATGARVPWYIMTSPDNHAETESFFLERDYFGRPQEDCVLFTQRMMPVLDLNGKLLFASESELLFAPSGNGECFASLKQSGALEDMRRRGVEWIFYYNVDNALIRIADPAFVGMAVSGRYPIATKVIEKTNAEEKIGIVCQRNGRPAVVEYTEIPQAMLESREQGGRLTYHLGNISIHMFRLDFVERYSDTDLPYHIATKKIGYMGEKGSMVSPAEPNAYKLERLIFDFFPLAEGMTIMKVDREGEFAPVKNKSGEDSPESARELVMRADEALRSSEEGRDALSIVNGPYLQWPTEQTMTFMWETSQPASGTVSVYEADRIHSGVHGNYRLHEQPLLTVSEAGADSRIHRLKADGFTPGTDYFYSVRSENDAGENVEAGPYPFRTAARNGVPVSFAVTSETGGYSYFDQSGGAINRAIFGQMAKYRPDFAIFAGDIVDDGRRQEDWHTYFFEPGKELLATTPAYSCLGNHENNGSWYYEYFDFPKPSNYYSFDYGDVHVVALDSTDFIKNEQYPDGDGSIGPGDAQYDFLVRDLESAAAAEAKWKIVFFHYSPYVSGGYEVEALRALSPVFEQYGVDVVFSSHTIVYERSYPLRGGKLDFDGGVVYIVAGGAGAMPEWLLPKRAWHTSQSLAVPHFVQVTAAEGILDIRAIDSEGRLFDTLQIRKSGDGTVKQFI